MKKVIYKFGQFVATLLILLPFVIVALYRRFDSLFDFLVSLIISLSYSYFMYNNLNNFKQ